MPINSYGESLPSTKPPKVPMLIQSLESLEKVCSELVEISERISSRVTLVCRPCPPRPELSKAEATGVALYDTLLTLRDRMVYSIEVLRSIDERLEI